MAAKTLGVTLQIAAIGGPDDVVACGVSWLHCSAAGGGGKEIWGFYEAVQQLRVALPGAVWSRAYNAWESGA